MVDVIPKILINTIKDKKMEKAAHVITLVLKLHDVLILELQKCEENKFGALDFILLEKSKLLKQTKNRTATNIKCCRCSAICKHIAFSSKSSD